MSFHPESIFSLSFSLPQDILSRGARKDGSRLAALGLLILLTFGCHQFPTGFSGHSGGMGEYSKADQEAIQEWQDAAAKGKGAQSVPPQQVFSEDDKSVHRDGHLRLRPDLFGKKGSKKKDADSSDSDRESSKKEKKGFSLKHQSEPFPDSPNIKGLTAPSPSAKKDSISSKQFGKIVPLSSSKSKSLLAADSSVSSRTSKSLRNNDMPAEMASLEERFPDFIVTLGGESYSPSPTALAHSPSPTKLKSGASISSRRETLSASVCSEESDSELESLLAESQANSTALPAQATKTDTSLLFPGYEIAETGASTPKHSTQTNLPQSTREDVANETDTKEGFACSGISNDVSHLENSQESGQESQTSFVGYSFTDFNTDTPSNNSSLLQGSISPAVSFTANFPALNPPITEESSESQETEPQETASAALPSPILPSPLEILADAVPPAKIFKKENKENIEENSEDADSADDWKKSALEAIALLQKKMAKDALTGEVYPEDQARLQLLLLSTCDVITTEDILANLTTPYKDLCKEECQKLGHLISNPSQSGSILKASFEQIHSSIPSIPSLKKEKADADENVQEQAVLSVKKSLFVKEAAPFGLYEKIDGKYAAGDSVSAYYELDNVCFKESENEDFEMDILCRRDLLDSEGKAVLEMQERLCSSHSFSVLRDIVLNLAVDLPADLAPGDYTLKITLLDKNQPAAVPVTQTMTLTVTP